MKVILLPCHFQYYKKYCVYVIFVFFQHEAEYLEILTAVKGSSKEKRLASQFIARFFKHFPTLADQAIEAQLDLCEDEDVAVSLSPPQHTHTHTYIQKLITIPDEDGFICIL